MGRMISKIVVLAFILFGLFTLVLYRDNTLDINETYELYVWAITYPIFLFLSIYFYSQYALKNKLKKYPFSNSSNIVKYPVYAFMSIITAAIGSGLIIINTSLAVDLLATEPFEIESKLEKILYSNGKGCHQTAYFAYEINKTTNLCLDPNIFVSSISSPPTLVHNNSYVLFGRKNGMGRVVDKIYEKNQRAF